MQTQISVRGEARRTIPPHSLTIDDSVWAELRSEAINAALDKARDYAAALGGTITAVEHVADPGLLNGFGQGEAADRRDVYAAVELRCLATIGPVAEQSRKWIDPGQVRPATNSSPIPAADPPAAEPVEPRRPRPTRFS